MPNIASSSPEILITGGPGNEAHPGGAGGIMLPNHARLRVAEIFTRWRPCTGAD